MNININDISCDIRVGNKVIATFTMNPVEIANTVESNVEKNTYKAPTESEQNNTGTINEIPPIDWNKVKEFVEKNNIPLAEQESGVLDFYITKGKLSPKQARVLDYVLKKVKEYGFTPSYAF